MVVSGCLQMPAFEKPAFGEDIPLEIMGILNITPDSFSDGGDFFSPDAALAQARRMAAEGAAWIDIGGESTRPGAQPVSVQEETDRVMPVLESIRAELPVKISVDTAKPALMRDAIAAGVEMINDVNALRTEGALEILAAAPATVRVCLMHKQGTPRTMQVNPHYDDVVAEVRDFLAARIAVCEAAGITRNRLYIDPGFGFGKTLEHNLRLMHHLDALHILGCPVLTGVSRKSMLGAILNKPVKERLYGGLGLSVWAVMRGACIIRTHDVAPTVDILQTIRAVCGAGDEAQT
jgi:dihydropteroate synthase